MRMLRRTITMPGTSDGDGDCATRNDGASPGCSIMRIIDPYSSVSELIRMIKKEIRPGK